MAHHSRSEQLIGARFSSLASGHLIEGLKGGKLRCMRESRTTPSVREWVPASFWYGLRIDAEPDLSLSRSFVAFRSKGTLPIFGRRSMAGHFLFGGRTSIVSGPGETVRETRIVGSEARTAT